MNLRIRRTERPAPVIDRDPSAPINQPATPEACRTDYATGKRARKNLGKPAE